jgi:hypothetical protein
MSSRSDALLEHPLSPLRVRIEPGFLFRSVAVQGIRVDDLLGTPTFAEVTRAPAFLVERVLASRAMYDPRQVFQCCMPNGEEPLVRDLCGQLRDEHRGDGLTSFIWQTQDQRSRTGTVESAGPEPNALVERVRRVER